MNLSYLTTLCVHLNLGSIINPITSLKGGLLHTIWKVQTTQGYFAIKELNPAIMERVNAYKNYELSEKVARYFFNHGIPALPCILFNNKSVIESEGKFFLIYPWIEGVALDTHTTNKEYAKKIGTLLAKIHALRLQIPEFSDTFSLSTIDTQYIQNLIDKVFMTTLPFKEKLFNLCQHIIHGNTLYQQALLTLSNRLVISHGDLDQKNVLWSCADNPTIIDWEAARLVNPPQEIISAALDWSGLPAKALNYELFVDIITAYKKASGIISFEYSIAALDYYAGNQIQWLLFNIERSLPNDNSAESKLGIEEVEKTLSLIEYFEAQREIIVSHVLMLH